MPKIQLPWRYRSLTNFLNEHTNFVFRHVLKTPAIECNPNAGVDYVSLICHRDIHIFLLACKSFLRFYRDVSVVADSDGTLTRSDIQVLQRQIPGIQIVRRLEADERVSNEIESDLLKAIRERDVSFIKLIDVNLFSTKRRIVVDSDILFLRPPTEIIDWIESDNNRAFHHVNLDANNRFREHLESFNKALNTNISSLDYCSGFIGYPSSLPFSDIDQVISVLRRIGEGWGLEQCAYAFLLMDRSDKLSERRYLAVMKNPTEKDARDAIMIHFVGKLRHYKYYTLGMKVITELRTPTDQ